MLYSSLDDLVLDWPVDGKSSQKIKNRIKLPFFHFDTVSNLLHTPKTVCLANIQHLILVIFFEPGNILVSEKVWKRLNSPWTEKQRIVSAPIITSFARNMIPAMIRVLDISYRFCDLPRTKVLVKFKRMHICKIYLDDLERNKDHILCQKVQIWAWSKRG